jgi:hypothetical protein
MGTYRNIVRVLGSLLALSLFCSYRVAAQEPPPSAVRGRWTISGGLLRYGTGGSGCADANGVATGLEVNTKGSWLVGVGVGFLKAFPQECIAIGRLGMFEGRWVLLTGGVRYQYSPQVILRVGKAVRIRNGLVEPALAGGYVRGRAEPERWQQWFGGSLRLAVGSLPLSLQIDHGRHAVSMQYVEDRQVLDEYQRWEPITVVSLRW